MRAGRGLARELAGALILFAFVAVVALLYSAGGGGANDQIMIVMLSNIVLVLSLQLFVGNTGVLPFGHTVFPAVAAYAAALAGTPAAIRAASVSELPFGLDGFEAGFVVALAIGVVVAVAVAAVLGVAVTRVSGLGASILTLALLVVVHQVLLNGSNVTGGAQGFFGIPVETTLGVGLVCVLLAILVARLFKGSLAGLWAQAAREDELAAEAMGVSVIRSRYVPWVLSAAIGGLGGGLLSFYLGVINPSGFYLDLTFTIVAFLILGGMRSVAGAVVGTMLLTAILEAARWLADGPAVGGLDLPEIVGLSQLCLGATILVVMIRRPAGLLGDHELDELLRFGRAKSAPVATAAPHEPAAGVPDRAAATLRVREVSKSFAGIVALSDVSLEVAPGAIVGVIGPNGAGKTTLLNVLSGNLVPTAGSIELDGRRIDGHSPAELARRGIARTFQNLRLFEQLSVHDNVEVSTAVAARHRTAFGRSTTAQLLADFGLTQRASDRAGTLAQGDRRRLEMARAVALSPTVLLLDEPTAGMNELEAQDLLTRINEVRDRFGCGVVVVDHNVPFIMELCEHIHVLNGGRQIAAGAPAEIQEHPDVIEAYLGLRATSGSA